jgi:hypothetical protein
MVKLKTAAEDVPEFVTIAEESAAPVVVEPTVMVAAVPVSPLTPCGMPKSKTALVDVPTLLTVALELAARVVTDPTVMVAPGPGRPVATTTVAGVGVDAVRVADSKN